MLHSFKLRRVKERLMAIKLDLQKAYDKMNWNFMKVVLKKFGFAETFVNQIFECVSSVSFSLLINGGISGDFKPSCGLRQGDPLSPYIFILCQEILSRMLEKNFAEGNLRGVKASSGGPTVTHIMFANDIVLFSKASRNEATILDDCLEKYLDGQVSYSTEISLGSLSQKPLRNLP